MGGQTTGPPTSSWGVLMARVVPDDPKEVKTKAISDVEISWVSNWTEALNRGLRDLAFALLETGTDFEHFRANLDENEASWTADQIADLEKYRVAFQTNLDILNPPPPPPPPPDPVLLISKGTVAAWNHANATAWDNVKVTNLANGSILLDEKFDNPAVVFANWKVVKAGTFYGTANWIVDDGRLKETVGGSAGTGMPWGRGTHAYYAPGAEWAHYQVEFDLESISNDDDPMGLLFRYNGQANCYRFGWGHQSNDAKVRGRQLVRMKDDQPIYLYKDQIGYGYSTGPKHVVIRINGNTIDISINGVLLIAGRDDAGITGINAWNSQLSDPPQSALLPI